MRLNQLGLLDFGVKDYLYFHRMALRLQPAIEERLRMGLIPKKEVLVSKVGGVYREDESSYRYLVVTVR